MTAKNKPKKRLNSYIQYSGAAFQMAITIYLGVVIGQYLDKKYPNGNQLYTIIFTLVFVLIALYLLVKKIIMEQKKKQ